MRSRLITRDSLAMLNGSKEVTEFPSGGLEIVAEDGRTLFDIRLVGDSIEISAGNVCKHEGQLLDDRYVIAPKASNMITITKIPYK